MSRKSARRDDVDVEELVSDIGGFAGELVLPVVLCAVVVGLVAFVRAHPIVSSLVLTCLMAGTVLVLSRRDARKGRPWRPRIYLIVLGVLAAVAGVVAIVVTTLARGCECA